MMRRAILLLCLALICGGEAKATPAFWFAGEDPVVRADRHAEGSEDYNDLFRPNAPWSEAASHLSVFKFSTQFLARSPSDATLQADLQDVRRRHIATAVEMGLLVRSPRCGQATEGFIDIQRLDSVTTRLRRLGATLDYVAMDEPLWNGHSPAARAGNPCHDPVSAVVANIAASLRRLQYSFPAVRVGDIEPITDRIDSATYAHDFAEFADEFRAATGQPLAFFHADIVWRQDWHDPLAMIRQVCRQRGIPFGVIFGGEPRAPSDADWVQQGIAHIEDIMGEPVFLPVDQVVIQSWQQQPSDFLPETSSGTMTYFLRAAEMRFR